MSTDWLSSTRTEQLAMARNWGLILGEKARGGTFPQQNLRSLRTSAPKQRGH
jgi:hypothetical protein